MPRFSFTAGILIRRRARRMMKALGLKFHEDKGWLDSQFTMVGSMDQIALVKAALDQHFGPEE